MRKVSELEGAELDYWVAMAEGLEQTHPYRWIDSDGNAVTDGIIWAPSTDWLQGGSLIERYKIDLEFGNELVYATTNIPGLYEHGQYGPTPLIAAMRALVASVYGDEIDAKSQ